MLATSVYIYNPSSLGGGQYNVEVYVNPSSKAKYLNIGDYLKDTAGNEYEVQSFNSPFADGGVITVSFVTSDVIPVEDADYNSSWYTPGQVDLRPAVQTGGEIRAPVLYSAPNYEYTILATWTNSAQANKAAVGDRIVDSQGYEFEISFLDPTSRFTANIRVVEIEPIGKPPVAGGATMYRGTPNRNFYQGGELTTAARTAIRNRDSQLVDQALIGSGGGGGGALTKLMESGHTGTIAAGVPIAKLSNGKIIPADSDGVGGAQQLIGITQEQILLGGVGSVYLFGQNVAGVITGLGFAVGEEVYLAETAGTYTNDPNSFTGDNDSIIKIGIADCAAGSASGTATDLILFPDVILRP